MGVSGKTQPAEQKITHIYAFAIPKLFQAKKALNYKMS